MIPMGHTLTRATGIAQPNAHVMTRKEAKAQFPDAHGIVVGELDSLISTSALVAKANAFGPYDVIIRNAGIGGVVAERAQMEDGFERIFHTNVIAPYMVTALMELPRRMIFLTSGLEANGAWSPEDLRWTNRSWKGMRAYSDSKLHDLMLALEVVARDPQVWLATSDDVDAKASRRYLKRRQVLAANPVTLDAIARTQLVDELARLSGVKLP